MTPTRREYSSEAVPFEFASCQAPMPDISGEAFPPFELDPWSRVRETW